MQAFELVICLRIVSNQHTIKCVIKQRKHKMPIAETLTLTLGPVLAKSILRLWLKDQTLLVDLSASVIDLLSLQTQDKLLQRKGERQFQAIGDSIAETLLPIYQREGSGFSEEALEAITYAVAHSFSKTDISTRLLAHLDLDPNRLASLIIESNTQQVIGFSTDEHNFYIRIVTEAAQDIVDISSKMPSFTENSFSEILKRESYLIEIVTQILQEIKLIRQRSQEDNSDIFAADFEANYLRAVIRNLDKMELFGATVSEASAKHPLSIAYVTLSVKQSNVESDDVNSEENLDQLTVSVDTALQDCKRLLIRGEAGSGKTTLLRWIAMRASSRSFGEKLVRWNDKIPFFIPLREYVDSDLPEPQEFPSTVAKTIIGEMPHGWVHKLFRAGRAILLVDGVDEISKRDKVKEWLTELIATFDDVPVIITSRSAAIEGDWLSSAYFEDAELQPMSISDIRVFIDQWHDAVKAVLQFEEEKNELAQLAIALKSRINNNLALRSLATSPLLCAMICALHRDRRQQLPRDRIELYEACSEMLLERRDIERKVDLRAYPSLSYRQKRVLLEDLAYHLIKNGWSDLSKDRVLERFSKRLSTMEGLRRSYSGLDVLKLFLERSGMLREPIVGRIDFPHKTFQEFLAAHKALDDDDTGVLVDHATNDQWREVIILAAGLAQEWQRADLIKLLIARGDNEISKRHQIHLLAVACLEAAPTIPQEIRQELNRRLQLLVPPKNITEAKALSSAGDLAVPYLVPKREYRATVAAACVRALALIGTESALSMLEEYKQDDRQTVSNELIRAWDYFDREEFAERILAKSKSITAITVSSLTGIEHLKSLEELCIKDNQEVTDLAFLEGLNIRRLQIENCSRLSDLTHLSSMNLNKLEIIKCGAIDTLEAIGKIKTLNTLKISDCPKIIDFSPLASLQSLQGLDLNQCHQITSLKFLSSLSHLNYVDVSFCNSIETIDETSDLPRLNYLTIWNCENLKHLKFRSSASYINWLQIGYTDGLALESFDNLQNIATLILSGFRSTVTDLPRLSYVESLREIDFKGFKKLTSLSCISNLSSAKTLTIQNCNSITDLDALEGFSSLTKLNISYCSSLVNLSVLAKLPKLQQLTISYCPITEISDVGNVITLKSLTLVGCSQLQSVSPLTGHQALEHLGLKNFHNSLDIDSLQNMPQLRTMNLKDSNAIKLPRSVDSLPKLVYLITPDGLTIYRSALRNMKSQ